MSSSGIERARARTHTHTHTHTGTRSMGLQPASSTHIHTHTHTHTHTQARAVGAYSLPPPHTHTHTPTHTVQAVGAYSLPTGQVRVRGQVRLAFAVRGAGSSDHRDKRTWVRRSPPPLSAPRLCALPLETVVSSRVPVETNIYRPLLL